MYHQPVGFQFALNQKKPWDALIFCRICSHFVSPHDNPPLPWLCLKVKRRFHRDSGSNIPTVQLMVSIYFFTFHIFPSFSGMILGLQGHVSLARHARCFVVVPGCKAAGFTRSLGPVATNLEATAPGHGEILGEATRTVR